MRPRLLLILGLLFPFSASAETVAGRTQVFFHDAWAPIGGGTLTPLGLPIQSVAFDGERFLAAWRDGEAVRLGLYDEGATSPVTEAVLEGAPGRPFVRWDGTRYVVIVASSPVQLAIVSRQGVVETRTTVAGASGIVDAAASPFGIALASHDGNAIDVLLLDTAYRVATRTNVISMPGNDAFLARVTIAPFGPAFLVAWQKSWGGRYQELSAARVLLDGSAPEVMVVDGPLYGHPLPAAIGLHPYGSRLAVTSARAAGFESTARVFGALGIRYSIRLLDAPSTIRTVRLPDGAIALVYANDGVATVKTLIPAAGPRRRSARH